MYFGSIFDEVQALMQEREMIAQRVQLEAEALRAQAARDPGRRPGAPTGAPGLTRALSHFRHPNRVRPW